MAKMGPILIVEDDPDDRDLFREMLTEIGVTNKLIFLGNAPDAFQHLKSNKGEQPFIIFSDINLPKLNGVEFKRQIDEDPELRARSIPFVFLSTSVQKSAVDEAYKKMTVQGFFQKSTDYHEQKKQLKLIMDYWTYCKHPNSEF